MPGRPATLAQETPTDASLSLNDHVGFADSFFRRRRGSPIALPMPGHSSRGVPPSPSVTALEALTGRRSSYRHIPGGRASQRRLSRRPWGTVGGYTANRLAGTEEAHL